MMKPKYTEQEYYAISEEDMQELEIVCDMMNSLSLELAFGKKDKDAAQKQARYILESFSKRLGDVIDNVGEKIFKRKDYAIARKGERVNMWVKDLRRQDEEYLASIMGADYDS
jgi:hypothetical protein